MLYPSRYDRDLIGAYSVQEPYGRRIHPAMAGILKGIGSRIIRKEKIVKKFQKAIDISEIVC